MVTIDAAGHLPNLEQPDAFNNALNSFLTDLPATTFSPGSALQL